MKLSFSVFVLTLAGVAFSTLSLSSVSFGFYGLEPPDFLQSAIDLGRQLGLFASQPQPSTNDGFLFGFWREAIFISINYIRQYIRFQFGAISFRASIWIGVVGIVAGLLLSVRYTVFVSLFVSGSESVALEVADTMDRSLIEVFDAVVPFPLLMSVMVPLVVLYNAREDHRENLSRKTKYSTAAWLGVVMGIPAFATAWILMPYFDQIAAHLSELI